MNTNKVWFITGASKGLGLALVQKLLAYNYRVAATSRTIDVLKQLIPNFSDTFLPLEMDILNDGNVRGSIEKVIAHFGQIDIIVNNAGYSQIGTQEELSDKEVKQNFEVNVFGLLNVIRHATPYLRRQRSGHIFNVSSIGGFIANFPGFGIYCATKFAVAGLTESLAEELKSFHINTTLIYPGYFRTNFLSGDSIKTPEFPIEEYKNAREVEQVHLNEINGNQPNDPEKSAEVIIKLSKEEKPPVHFFMGEDSYALALEKIASLQKALDEFKLLSCSTGYENKTTI